MFQSRKDIDVNFENTLYHERTNRRIQITFSERGILLRWKLTKQMSLWEKTNTSNDVSGCIPLYISIDWLDFLSKQSLDIEPFSILCTVWYLAFLTDISPLALQTRAKYVYPNLNIYLYFHTFMISVKKYINIFCYLNFFSWKKSYLNKENRVPSS